VYTYDEDYYKVNNDKFWRYRKRWFCLLPSGYEQPDTPMSIGIVEKLFEPLASSFPPDGRYQALRNTFKSSQRSTNSFKLVSTKEAFGFFCVLTKETRRQALALRNALESKT
jgi:hypothetical protein